MAAFNILGDRYFPAALRKYNSLRQNILGVEFMLSFSCFMLSNQCTGLMFLIQRLKSFCCSFR